MAEGIKVGAGAAVRQPMATVVICVIVSSTIRLMLSLPALYRRWHRNVELSRLGKR